MTYGIYIEGSGDMETTRIITSCSSIHMICMHIQIVHSNKAYMLRGGGGGVQFWENWRARQIFVYNYLCTIIGHALTKCSHLMHNSQTNLEGCSKTSLHRQVLCGAFSGATSNAYAHLLSSPSNTSSWRVSTSMSPAHLVILPNSLRQLQNCR